MVAAYVALEGGSVVEARCRAPGTSHGELVFTTAYTGYEESLTDPSYEEQVLTFSYPLIGNYGVRPERFEDERVHPRAVVARELTDDVADWLTEEGVPAVDKLDTRDLVGQIREGGAMKCGISAGPDASPEAAKEALADCPGMSDHTDIGAQVSVSQRETFEGGDGPDVALVDCGAKGSITDSLLDRGATVHVLPYDVSPGEVADLDPDVLFVSNGPGDPANFETAQSLVEEFVGEIPLAGICLGQQIVARALGGTTEKMDFGHRGVNQPVRDLRTDRVVMTTQNHGYTVAEPGPKLDVTQVNVNDDTAEGLESDDLNVITRQYHPEANPGPHDSLDFFDDVLAMAGDERRTPVAAD
ncbi:glutamine-hydrolyzing carbamoyl-phosphate synthase small subunit [Halorussus sp. MSC15.2]|uniref:glutamine-hydrolyzing carbamoyl-phosphate synthase small subunit n=1 Tax=Halorussus sp. MSC15.2 TaxID=2283638 RepID=UPI0013D86C5F|nr:glutamine-hydrolyzing carbamoyl-phosphate synthase small subunit [Halorussus sp. MSC15.2]NEU55900.1 glutamine-hydrolyzing carbamoyl-phosphate synthase small subunit [Halorussus sp. MSC15.2]